MSEVPPQGTLVGRHALVTGAGRGIGAAIVATLARHGAPVSLLGRDRAALEALAQTLAPARTFIAVADITDGASVAHAVALAREALGPVHILVNNAGQAGSAPLQRTDDALWERMLAVNLTGAWRMIREVFPDMLALRYGRIVNVASTAGLKGYSYASAYCASKHGVVGLTRAAALEVATKGITVNAVCPGYTDTDLVRTAIATIRTKTGRTEDEAIAALVAVNPQGRLVQPAEVANAVAWLCLPGSESVTGQSIAVAGGEVE